MSTPIEPENSPQGANGGRVVQRWVNALAGAQTTVPGRDGKDKRLSWSEKALGMVIANHANWSKGTVFIGTEKLAEITESDERNVKARRAALKAHGWLVETGNYRMGCKVFQLTIPE
ncbi:hypothetical protein ACFU53_17890 [Streptomyces sp. NPDC057474]|uniref:hypothetical protein n=1 Tax=Streptomyces sp. NPDC057474 TaxID=3346144 RepID=UPI0036A5DE6F